MTSDSDDQILAEANAFNEKMLEKLACGFVPDLRRVVKCEKFEKNFWRDPYLVSLCMGKHVEYLLHLLSQYAQPKAKILDVGCGAGYVSLELARAGYHVTGIDVADQAIKAAQRTLDENSFHDGFGSLNYRTIPFHLMDGRFDAVLFSAALHHLPDIDGAVQWASSSETYPIIRP